MTTVHITKHCFYQELMLMSMIRETNLIKRKEKKNKTKQNYFSVQFQHINNCLARTTSQNGKESGAGRGIPYFYIPAQTRAPDAHQSHLSEAAPSSIRSPRLGL